jgi:hypothetical protein
MSLRVPVKTKVINLQFISMWMPIHIIIFHPFQDKRRLIYGAVKRYKEDKYRMFQNERNQYNGIRKLKLKFYVIINI